MIKLEVFCSDFDCASSNTVEARVENERLVADVPPSWAPVLLEHENEQYEALFCGPCARKIKTRWKRGKE